MTDGTRNKINYNLQLDTDYTRQGDNWNWITNKSTYDSTHGVQGNFKTEIHERTSKWRNNKKIINQFNITFILCVLKKDESIKITNNSLLKLQIFNIYINYII